MWLKLRKWKRTISSFFGVTGDYNYCISLFHVSLFPFSYFEVSDQFSQERIGINGLLLDAIPASYIF
jgi:hypothetical protein